MVASSMQSAAWELHAEALTFIERDVHDEDLKASLRAYLDFVIKREK